MSGGDHRGQRTSKRSVFTADIEVKTGHSMWPEPQACKAHCKLGFGGGLVWLSGKSTGLEQENPKPISEPATLTSCVTMNFLLDLSEPQYPI